MEFPVWVVPVLTAPMLIPTVAIPHVFVAQFAVGGGIVLAYLVHQSYRQNRPDVRDELRTLTRYFVLITLVFGAVTGVGIWWTIGLTAPETTRALIHTFVFGWATEWVAFAVEIASAFAFYYYWDRLAPRDHIRMGWIYAVAAWISLVLITGITSFMLTTGAWRPGRGFWTAFFNPSLIPQVLVRTGGSLALAALWIGWFLSFRPRSSAIDWIMQSVSRWALLGMIGILIGGAGFFRLLPEHAEINLLRAPMLIVMTAINFAITVVVIAALALGVAAGSRWITPPAAGLLLLAGFLAVTTGEFIREGSRKPYRIDHYILAPGVRVSDVATIRKRGFIASSPWLHQYLAYRHPEWLRRPTENPEVGRAIFAYHCASCHAVWGYNGIAPIVRPWTPAMIREALRELHRANPAMPPWLGNFHERNALARYLETFSRGTIHPWE